MRPIQSLRAKLDAYEATSRAHATAGKGRRRAWSTFATAAGSGLALATAADADIIYSGIKDLIATASTNGGPASIKIGMDGQSFVGIVARQQGGATTAFASLIGGGGLQMLRNGSLQLKYLASGAKISTNAGAFRTQGALRSSISDIGHFSRGTWPRTQAGFAGVEFTQGGQKHFGWIQLEWTGSNFGALDNAPRTLTAIDWAYQSTPDTPIDAGAGIPPSVPEPNTAMIAWLASGCAGVLAWRKHRRQLAEPAQAATAEAASDNAPR